MTKFNKILRKKTEKLLIKEFISLFKGLLVKKEKNKRFSFAIPGGRSPVNLLRSLSKEKINWKKIDLFWVDERYVSRNSNYLNFNLAKKYLINKIEINKENIFNINTNKKSSHESAKDYKKRLRLYFKTKRFCFDLILLGVGSDGHIASIFPNKKDLKNKDSVFTVLRDDFERISLNLKTINASKKIVLWLNNKSKSLNYLKIKNRNNVPVNKINKKKTNLFMIK
ncbi:MAG: 6-phosphogluconolactonase [Pelagibacteraceae bacterium]